jgi:2'-5' RNA ligase
MRLFVAVELDAVARGHLVDMQRQIDRAFRDHSIRWTQPENLHITIKFIGEVGDAEVAILAKALSGVGFESTSVRAEGLLCLPPRGPVRVVAAEIGGDVAPIEELHTRVDEVCASVGVMRENRAYLPHVTIGRNRPGAYQKIAGFLRSKVRTEPWPGPPFDVRSFVLMQSELRKGEQGGSKYVVVARFP